MPHSQKPTEFVTSEIIQQHFNNGQFLERAATGEITTQISKDKHLTNPPPGHPVCTRSQFLRFYTPDGKYVAGAHQYLCPDGTIGGSGRPDPKYLNLDDRIIGVRAKPQERSQSTDS